MAAVIHELWMGSDAGLLIMPGSLPMDVPNVRDELTRHLSEGWNALVDKEVDGKHSRPYQQDQAVSRYGKLLASRRVARTIMLGSAPTVRQQSVRGVEAAGCDSVYRSRRKHRGVQRRAQRAPEFSCLPLYESVCRSFLVRHATHAPQNRRRPRHAGL